jgi:hypothetical protein
MTIEIDELSASVRVAPAADPARSPSGAIPSGARPASPAAVLDSAALLEVLRPLIRRLLQEELELTLRARGMR